MKSIYLDLTSILNRALERASENLSFNKLLVQIGVDPSNITFDAVVQRLVDIVVANINVASFESIKSMNIEPQGQQKQTNAENPKAETLPLRHRRFRLFRGMLIHPNLES